MFIETERLDALRKGAAASKAEGYVQLRTVDLRWLVGLVDHFVAQEVAASPTKAAPPVVTPAAEADPASAPQVDSPGDEA